MADSNAIDFVSTASRSNYENRCPGGGYGLGTAAYSADGKLLAAGSYAYGTIKVWDLGVDASAVDSLRAEPPCRGVTFQPRTESC